MRTVPHILATAGHVDHGKSSLVRALTGTDPDRLPEEKARGITIDLGFAQLRLPARTELEIGIIDVPGHEDFVKNMVAGLAGVEAAMLVVAADDGWMPQTQEHLEILLYLGIHRGIVAITKGDMAPDGATRTQIADKLRGTPFAGSPLITTSTKTGEGIPQLRQALVKLFEPLPSPPDIAKPRLAVDRAFSLHGAGTIVTGTLIGGRLTRGQHVVVQPRKQGARLRTLQTHNRDVDHALPGMRAALNLPELEAAVTVRRGDVVTIDECGSPSDCWDVHLWRVSESITVPALRDGVTIHVHHGSAAVKGTVSFAEGARLEPGQQRIARIRLEHPLFALAGDRFLLRDASAQWTLAGGLLLDPHPPAKRWRQRLPEYARRADAPGDPSVWLETALAWRPVLVRAGVLKETVFSAEQIQAAVEALRADGRLLCVGDLVARRAWWDALRVQAATAVDAHHAGRPQERGIPLAALQAALAAHVSPTVFRVLVGALCEEGFVRAGTFLKRADHQPALPPALEGAGRRLRIILAASPLEPPSRAQLAPDPRARAALSFLLDTGEAIEISADLVLAAEAYSAAADRVTAYLQQHGKATVSELKQAIGTSRRVMVPLLERFDKEGVTRRAGDLRVLGAAPLDS